MANTSIKAAFERMWQHITSALSNKSDISHNHNDIYYTESEIDTKLQSKSDTTHNHDAVYDAKGAAAESLASAKSYTDTKTSGLASTTIVDNKISAHNTSTASHSDIRDLIAGLTTRLNALANSDDTTLDQMSEIVDYIKNNKSLIDGITTNKINVSDIVNNLTTNISNKPLSAAQGVAIKALIDALQEELDTHTHAISDVSGLQSALDGKAASSHGIHVSYSSTAPVMDGTASVGTASTVARSDHKHPTDTSRASKTEFDTHTSNTTVHITSTERSNWNAAKSHADSAHAPSNAEKNQNAFSNITVGSTTVAADSATDTVTFVGNNVTITPDATNDKITFEVADGSTSTKGLVKLTNSTSSTSTTTAATPSSVKSAYDLANTAKTNAATAQAKADSAYALAESKADVNHTHNYAGSSSAGGSATSAVKLDISTAGSATQPVYFTDGKPVKTTHTLGASVPSDAKFTDTTYGVVSTTANGLAPKRDGSTTKFLRGDGTWAVPPDTNTTYSAATTSADGLMSATDKTKLNNTNIAYGTCSTAADTAAKVITISGNTNWTLTAGSLIMVKFTYTNEAENPTFNVNGTGAKSVWYGTSVITTSSLSYAGYANRPATYMYDGTQFVFVSWSYDTNTTYTNVKLGHGYATCSTAAETTAKTASLSSYTLTTGGIVAVKFTYDVPASATLNINSKGAKSIYHKGAAIAAGVIKAGDTATFIYSTRYHLISLDRDTSYSAATQSAAGLMSADDKKKLDGIATGANNYTYTLPNATSSVLGGVKIGSNISVSSGTISLTKANVTSALGYTPPDTNTTYSAATTSTAGLMSAADKTKLDGINLASYLPLSGGNITDNVTFNNGKGVMGKDSAGTAQYLMFMSTSNTLQFGFNMPSTYTAKFNIPISGTLHLNSTTDASSTADNAAPLIIGNRSGEHLVFDGNEIIPKSGAKAGGTLYLGDSENTVISISGKFRLNSYSYGTSLPTAGTAGRIFFKKA